jgi:NAD(P)-dependent dehydrogenase (short-subunit alcohol dehydrogenase family)
MKYLLITLDAKNVAKAAVVNFSKTISDEWEDDGILVNVINPQRTMIPMRLKPYGEKPIDMLKMFFCQSTVIFLSKYI